MRILYFYQYFSTSKGSWGTRVHEFASEWVKKGHEVTVVTSIYSKSDLTTMQHPKDVVVDGIRVKVLNILIDNKQSFFKRILSFIRYAVLSSWYALTLPADVVIASSGPITVGFPGLVAHYFRRRKLVFETRDLWPEGAIELGIIKNPLVKSIAFWFEKRCVRAASLVVALSPGMADYLRKKHPGAAVVSVTNAANIQLFSQTVPITGRIPGLTPGKYGIYTGNIGRVNHSMWLFDAAVALSQTGRKDIKIVLVGDGQQKAELQTKLQESGIENFILADLMPKTELVPLLQHSLASLVPLLPSPVLDTSSPNKFFESLAAGVPVVQTTNGWMKDFLELHHVGFTVDPRHPESLAKQLIALDGMQTEREEMRRKCLAVAEAEFDKNRLAEKMLAEIIRATGNESAKGIGLQTR